MRRTPRTFALEALVFARDEVINLVSAPDRADEHEPSGARLPLVVLPTHLGHARLVLIERGVVGDQHNAWPERERGRVDSEFALVATGQVGKPKWRGRRRQRGRHEGPGLRCRVGFFRLCCDAARDNQKDGDGQQDAADQALNSHRFLSKIGLPGAAKPHTLALDRLVGRAVPRRSRRSAASIHE